VTICIPVNQDQGLASAVCAHFGSAPFFMLVDTDTGACRALANLNQHHAHGMCQPLAALGGEQIDAIVVGGIGMGALSKLMAAGMGVFRAEHATVEETVAALRNGQLQAMTPAAACGHHGHGHAMSH
jgi:predicted Fe-Mo cluster-binding NifX family protein